MLASVNQVSSNFSSSYAPSSIIENQDGLPVRLHGKIKYAEEILKKEKRVKLVTIVRAVMAVISVSLMQMQNEILVNNNYQASEGIGIMKTVVTSMTALEICFIVIFFTDKFTLYKLKNDLTR
jgi:uncharacterized membrane protein YcjF (UPF0283 family)